MNHSKTARTFTRGFRLFAIASLLAMLAGLLAVAQPVGAGTYEVTITDNDGAGSLREAIRDAKAHPGADIITFAASTDGEPIVLSGPAGENGNASGDLDILDNGDLTIQGNGEGNTIIDGDGNDRVFHICPGGGCTNTITLSGMTIQNGNVNIIGGGGIRNKGGTTIVDSSAIRENSAPNGGGIANFATLTIQNSTIGGTGGGNHATSGSGGGIYNYAGTLTVDHTVVSDNTAYNNGGGMWNQVSLIVRSGSFIGEAGAPNTAGADGGGIYNYDGTTTVNGSAVNANEAGSYGGGIYNLTGTTTVDSSIVSANKADIAAGVDAGGGGICNKGTLFVQNGSTIGGAGVGNSADDGGGIYNLEGATTTVDGSTVSANAAIHVGGGIYNRGTLTVQNGSIIGGESAGNKANAGGGIYNSAGTTMVDNSTVSGNTATHSGGGIKNRETLNILNGSIIGGAGAGNTADAGGGIYNGFGATTLLNGSRIIANRANYDGGGIYNRNGTMTVDSSTISANMAIDNAGGIYNWGTLIVQNGSTIGGAGAGNMATSGGGIYDKNGTTTVDGSTISHNTVTEDGAGIYIWNGIMTVTGGTVSANTAGSNGGGFFNAAGTTTVTDICFHNNTAVNNGGGVFSDTDVDGETSVTGSSIIGNSDVSFFNPRAVDQIATGNWWGAVTGPNTLGADTTSDYVLTDVHRTEPLPGCLFYGYLPVILN